MIPFLDRQHNGLPTASARPARQARVQVIAPAVPQGANQLFELVVDLEKQVVVKLENLKGKHSYIDSSYMSEVEKACLADARVQAEIQTLQLPPEAVVCVEAWAYATDGMNDMSERTTMVCHYIRSFIRLSRSDYASAGSICVLLTTRMPIITHTHWMSAPK
jgi:primary-amine oxidase